MLAQEQVGFSKGGNRYNEIQMMKHHDSAGFQGGVFQHRRDLGIL
jgi:hypothetical protein